MREHTEPTTEASAPARSPSHVAPPQVAPRQAAILALQRSAGNRATGAMLQRMAACPARLNDSDPVPAGWKPYPGPSGVFHCGYRGILEDRKPSPADPMNECFYDHSGRLVDSSHPDADCGGTPDDYDSSTDPIKHTFTDRGGIWAKGWDAFWASRTQGIRADARQLDSWWSYQKSRWMYGGR